MKRRCKQTILSKSLKQFVTLQCPHDAVNDTAYCEQHQLKELKEEA